ncbi:hypothetical protein [Winogradskyella sp.]|uniref:hypothetical protein n=1 Tax=Winogradskyella sp. TaxID=1883156 RepID=UPI003BA84E3D
MDVRHYDAAIARWTGIDPVTHHSMSTYLAFDGNPVYWADPSGADSENDWESTVAAWNAEYEAWENGASLRDVWGSGNISSRNSSSNNKASSKNSTWKPVVNDDGTVSYIAGASSSAETLAFQYGLSQEDAEAITGTTGSTEIIEGTVISGETVSEVTGNEVLKLYDWSNTQKNLDQTMFAAHHARSKGENVFIMMRYFDISDKPLLPVRLDGYINVDGSDVRVVSELFVHSLQGSSVMGIERKNKRYISYAYDVKTTLNVKYVKGTAMGSYGNQANYKVNSYLNLEAGLKRLSYSIFTTRSEDLKKFVKYFERKF